MAPIAVLDTAALIAWPLEAMRGGIVLESQKVELGRVAPERLLVLEAADLKWHSPNDDSMGKAEEMAIGTGDMAGLSSIDLNLLALAMEHEATLFTDDYRLQNICEKGGIPWATVSTRGISSIWSWEIRCPGCGAEQEIPSQTPVKKGDFGVCNACGSPLRVKRKN
ncbi:MAG: hypothetical protein QGF28_05210 [Candidatus Thalassarchaeaceae archaeon]|jgi:UPF0271 protein|nr:hypothetical protein [Candidatus Thalassarchaeaceae archaeon]MDP7092425.1 hypothetical protein [Candidatus Thalassarchaeaceae archaeon]MDP7257241.1 hypothetical protein [Candidatus Thalassarchaeaceae archaeon]MDP7446579.1 hypothetical protein [Candidatus Thalassarchaeaceae archaeon]MDP7648580.1 hypothetical protein [Candidatus Thalassarchaeaceae archaeon]|tara:strand:- start:3114 stop:3611 length:498 start_codon:yes stop_codon:yes gene_type:complete